MLIILRGYDLQEISSCCVTLLQHYLFRAFMVTTPDAGKVT